MSSSIENISSSKNLTEYTADYILNSNKNLNFEDTAVIMPSKRPVLFIKKQLSKKIKKPFIPPDFFTFDELVEEISLKLLNKTVISKIDANYVIYDIVKKYVPNFYQHNKSFSSFFEWANEIFNFIEALDVEKVPNKKLLNIKLNADIGYDVTEDINELLKNLYLVREQFHDYLNKTNQTTRCYSYYNADSKISLFTGKYKQIILFNPYYLNKSEFDMFKILFKQNKLNIITQGNPYKWDCLKQIYTEFNVALPKNIPEKELKSNIKFYSAYDNQAQACLVKNLISKLPKKELSDTVIILPDGNALSSVMAELYSVTKNINIALGYPASKTTVFTLINTLIKAQKNKKEDSSYYTNDVLEILNNPLIKNLRFIGNPQVTRITVHKILEHFDKNNKHALFKDYSFINLNLVKNNEHILNEISNTVSIYWQDVPAKRVQDIIDEMFDLFFYKIANIKTINQLGNYLKLIADTISTKSLINTYSLNLGAVNLLYSFAGQLQKTICSNEDFKFNEILSLLENILKEEKISLTGSPLQDLQIIGALEARGLAFKNVFVMSMADNIMPYTKQVNPLIPQDIMSFLGIGTVTKNIDIQKFHFTSLISSSSNAYLIYVEDEQNTKSRFMEELIWDKQKKLNDIESIKVIPAVLPVKAFTKEKKEFEKTESIKQILKDLRYSATNIDTYLECKLKFYFQFVLNLSKSNNFEQDNENQELGIFFHSFLENTLKKGLTKKDFTDDFFKQYIQKLEDAFDAKFKQKSGKMYLLKKLVIKKMTDFYKNEQSPERNFNMIIGTESKMDTTITLNNTQYTLTAQIDRTEIDSNGKIYIIDYKSGSTAKIPSNKILEKSYIYSRENIKNNIKSFQLPIYKYIYENKNGTTVENCMLYSLKEAETKPLFNKGLNTDLYNEYINQLKFIIEEINSNIPFKQESYDDTEKCKNCPYFFLCN